MWLLPVFFWTRGKTNDVTTERPSESAEPETGPEWLGLSLREMAMLIKPQGVRPQKHLGKATIAAWENPRDKRKPSAGQVRQVWQLTATKLTQEMGRTVGITMRVNSPWRIKTHVQCCVCGKWFEIKRETSRRCARCVQKGKR